MSSGEPARVRTMPGIPRQAAFTARQAGFTYVALMLAVAIMSLGFAATAEVWSQTRQREKERELLFTGNQFRQAIRDYYERTPGAVKRYPSRLEDLLNDKRYLTNQRHLRKIFHDPMTGKAQWGLIQAPQGGIMGVYSPAEGTPVKTSGFRVVDRMFEGATAYSDWRFEFEPLPPQLDPRVAAKPGGA
jgi:type II secretory pathway pseudopilin PulG